MSATHPRPAPRTLRPWRSWWPSLLLSAAFVALAPGCSEDISQPPAPVRIVLVTLDTLRHDAFHGADGQGSHMPETSEYAARGQVFENFYSATSTTQPSHATMFTGLHPWQHGVQRNGAVLADELQTLPEHLAAAGFDTAAVVASYPLHRAFGFAQGFESYDDQFSVTVPFSSWEGERLRSGGFYSLAADVTERALQSLDQLTGDQQFLWVHYYDAHEPYGDTASTGAPLSLTEVLQAARISDPAVPAMVARAQELYRTDVSFLDRALGRLFARLDEDGERWRTHVIVTTDHGESFGEDGSLGHGKRLTKEQLLVPTFLVSPDVAAATRADIAGSIDIGATVLSFAEIDGAEFGGRDLSAPLKPNRDTVAFGMRRTFLKPLVDFRTDGTMVREFGPRFFAVIDGQLLTGVAGEVYEGDLPERPVTDARSPRLNTLFQAFAAELEGSEMNENIDPETLRSLEALGYVR